MFFFAQTPPRPPAATTGLIYGPASPLFPNRPGQSGYPGLIYGPSPQQQLFLEQQQEQAAAEEAYQRWEQLQQQRQASALAQASLQGVGGTPASQMQEAAVAFGLPGANSPYRAAGYTSAPPSQAASAAVEGGSSSSAAAAAEEEPAPEFDIVSLLAEKIAGFAEKDEWERSIKLLLVDAKTKLKTPKLSESRQGVAESLVNVIETEKAKAIRPEIKYNHIVKSKEAKQFVLAFYTDMHVKKIPGAVARMHEVHQSSSSGITTTQEPAKQYSDIVTETKASGSSGRAASSAIGPGRSRKSGPTGG